jgi:tripartite-type tricarboxylate transporter receptor subunit TctC
MTTINITRFVRATASLGLAVLSGALLSAAASTAAAEDFYGGKQLTFIVGAGVGGGYDKQARVVARHLAKHIPGNPSIVVQNMPSRIAATNHMYAVAPADGTVIALIQRNMLLARLTYPESIRFEIQKFNWLGSLNSETAVTLAWHTAPHKTAKDLFDKELIVGGITSVDPETTPKLYNALIGTKFKVVTGYNSTSQIALAIERGEVQGIGDWSWSSLKAVRPHWLTEKKVTLLMQGALKKEPELGNLPSALDFIKNEADRQVLQLHFTQKTAARPVVAPPGVPKERVALLRKAFGDLMRDREFMADVKKTRLEIDFVPSEEIEKVVKLITSTPADVAARYTAAFAPRNK